jgi:putative tryptophan/tyrosine transport system substrate-binding protein
MPRAGVYTRASTPLLLVILQGILEDTTMPHRALGLLVTLALSLLMAPLGTHAQPSGKVYRIGVLATTSWPPFDSFREGLRELGDVEGHNLALEYRWAAPRTPLFPDLAADLVRGEVDVIVTWGTPAAQAAKRATSTIPIGMAASGDALRTGLVPSLAHPGGNLTGRSALHLTLEHKRLELRQEAVPTASRIAVLWQPANPSAPFVRNDMQEAAPHLGVQRLPLEVHRATDVEGALAAMTRQHANALVVSSDACFGLQRTRIAELASQHRLPAIYLHTEHGPAGGLMTYGPNSHACFRRAATDGDKIFQGVKPGDLPIEPPVRFALAITRTAAQALGLTIPPSLLVQADKVIRAACHHPWQKKGGFTPHQRQGSSDERCTLHRILCQLEERSALVVRISPSSSQGF